MLLRALFSVLLLFLPLWGAREEVPAIIPRPAVVETRPGAFAIAAARAILVQPDTPEMRGTGEALAAAMAQAGRRIPVLADKTAAPRGGRILLSLGGTESLGPEGYELEIRTDGIALSAHRPAGLFYGVQTLRQMLAPQKGPAVLPCVKILDRPRLRWRGLMLDVSRTFLPLDYLKRTADRMALYKLNVMHLHLTDDQGWRLEIDKYPALTAVGARFDERYGGGGGFYTQEEMRGFLRYAHERGITVVPEIEFPGHSVAAIASYPELACELRDPPKLDIAPFWYAASNITPPLCAGNEKVFEMYSAIFREVISLFPSEFIHLGGDEVPKEAWKECPRCQARMRAEGLKDTEQLQSYAVKRIVKLIAEQGRRAIGWDEILEGGLAPGAAVMSWRGTAGGVAAAQLGHDVVMSPNTECYFDYTYLRVPTERVYAYEPLSGDLAGDAGARVLGVQANMWTHIEETEKAIDWQLYPRLLALAEVGWSPPATRNWVDFERRLAVQTRMLHVLGVPYFDAEEYAKAARAGDWEPAQVEGETPRVLEWEITRLIGGSGEYPVYVRRERGDKTVFVRSVVLLENGREISRATYPGPLGVHDSVVIGWFRLAARKPGARYTLRLGIQGALNADLAASVWIGQPAPAALATVSGPRR